MPSLDMHLEILRLNEPMILRTPGFIRSAEIKISDESWYQL